MFKDLKIYSLTSWTIIIRYESIPFFLATIVPEKLLFSVVTEQERIELTEKGIEVVSGKKRSPLLTHGDGYKNADDSGVASILVVPDIPEPEKSWNNEYTLSISTHYTENGTLRTGTYKRMLRSPLQVTGITSTLSSLN